MSPLILRQEAVKTIQRPNTTIRTSTADQEPDAGTAVKANVRRISAIGSHQQAVGNSRSSIVANWVPNDGACGLTSAYRPTNTKPCAPAYRFSPARMAIGRMFSETGSGQVA